MKDDKKLDWAPPPRIEELYASTDGNKFTGINLPTAGARSEQAAERGSAPFQVYSLATPNGQKLGIMLEELCDAHVGFEYDAHVISLGGSQFTSGFVQVNPNSKIPAAVDHAPGHFSDDTSPMYLFESAAIMMYLAEKFNRFIPKDPRGRAECIQWLFWQMAGQGPMTGNFGHFMVYAPDEKKEARDYGVARYGMEVQRLCSVLDNHLKDREFMAGGEYSIADMACLPWFQMIRGAKGYRHPSGVGARDFLSVAQYTHACAWADRLMARAAVVRGIAVCRKVAKPWLDPKLWPKMKHSIESRDEKPRSNL